MNSSSLVGVLSFASLLAASFVLSFAAGRTASASPAGRAPVAVVRDAGEPTVIVEQDEPAVPPGPAP